MHLSASTPSSNTNLVTSDFPNIGRTSFGSITYANFPASNAYGDITINSTGLVAISKTSITKYGLSFDWDLYNSFTGSWNSTGASSFTINSAESGGVSTDPKLVVTYTLPANPKQDVIWFD